MKVLFCASEVAPFVKTGGLGDVAGSLPLALGKLGVEVVIVLPRYRGIKSRHEKLSKNVRIYFVENERFFNRASLYGNEGGDYPDNLERFSFFSNAALKLAKEIKFRPQIVHAHDWQTALMPVILKTKLLKDPFFKGTRTLLTIHNVAYQGLFPHRLYPELGLGHSLFSIDGFEFYGRINFLKAGILFADALNTVSPTYAKEIQTSQYGYGLDGVIRKRARRLRGILNGIDDELWNPEHDEKIKKSYSAQTLHGKAACKADLQRHCHFEVNAGIPLFGMVTRLAHQKGLDLLSGIADEFLSKEVQFVLLGTGDGVYHTTFDNIRKRHPKNAAITLGFDAMEAHRIYAGSDFFLMPSLFEPCGLGQLISLRYGTIPIARHTGGLADTIRDTDRDPVHGNGFSFEEKNPEKFLRAIERALTAFKDKKRFAVLRRRAMRADFSWKHSAKDYVKYYEEILKS